MPDLLVKKKLYFRFQC